MDANDYLKKVLEKQTFREDEPELEKLRKRREEIEETLRDHFPNSRPSIRWGGSVAKKTMIREAYDGDMTCYFPHDEKEAGETLEEIYENVAEALKKRFTVERKTSALRVKDRSTENEKGFPEDLHIDVVPGRFVNEDTADVFLHRTTGEKERLKTNLDVHIDHIRDSGVRPAIRLMKLWNVRNAVGAKTFVLELLVVELLKGRIADPLSEQLKHVWTEFRDHRDRLSVEDPANPKGNDLKPLLDQVRHRLSIVARDTLWTIENSGWEAVFGPVDDNGDGPNLKAGLKAAAADVTNPTKPWHPGA